MGKRDGRSVEEQLQIVFSARVPAPDAEPWDYGWCLEKYRRSPTAAATGPDSVPVRLSPEGVKALEEAMARLLEREPIRRAWDQEELWGVVLTAVTTLPANTSSTFDALKQRLERIVAVGPTFVAFELANVAWSGPPRAIGDAVVGAAGEAWIAAVREASKGRPIASEARLIELTRNEGPGGGVLYGAWVMAQASRARSLAEQRFEETVALALLLEPDLASLKLYSGRGDSHRPGIRGLVVDREALVSLKEASKELAAHIVVTGPIREHRSTQWWGNDPFPLARLLERPSRSESIDAIVGSEGSVSRRLAIAATWYAQSHWSKRTEDAVLGLGVAFDALLGDRSGLPGRVVADRFALIEPEPELRAGRAKRFGELYAARSAVAHGGRPREIDEDHFSRGMAADVRWAAQKILSLIRTFDVRSEDAYRSLYEDLKWGTKQHPPQPALSEPGPPDDGNVAPCGTTPTARVP
jgi:hypothetical protein